MPRTSNLLCAFEANVPRESTCSRVSHGHGQMRWMPYLWALVVYGDLVVAVAVLAGEERLQGWLDLDEEAAGLRGYFVCTL